MAAVILNSVSGVKEVFGIYFNVEVEEAKTLYYVHFQRAKYPHSFWNTEKVSKKQASSIDEAIKVAFEQYTADENRCNFEILTAKKKYEEKRDAYVAAVLQVADEAKEKQCSKAAAGSYVVQIYLAGWQDKAVFAPNQYKQAEKYMYLQNNKNVQIIKLY